MHEHTLKTAQFRGWELTHTHTPPHKHTHTYIHTHTHTHTHIHTHLRDILVWLRRLLGHELGWGDPDSNALGRKIAQHLSIRKWTKERKFKRARRLQLKEKKGFNGKYISRIKAHSHAHAHMYHTTKHAHIQTHKHIYKHTHIYIYIYIYPSSMLTSW